MFDIGIYTNRWSEYLPRLLESIGRYTAESYNLVMVLEEGNCHQNCRKVFERAKNRFLVIMDEDVQLIHDEWWPQLQLVLEERDDVAIVGTREIKHEYEDLLDGPPFFVETVALPAYLIAIDREKVPNIKYDDRMPGLLGMSDVDLCLQARDEGYIVGRHNGVCVLHKKIPELTDPEIHDFQSNLRQGEFKEQYEYMAEKWGSDKFSKLWIGGIFS